MRELDEHVLVALLERPGQSVARLARHPEVVACLEPLERGCIEDVNRFYRVRGALRRLRDEGFVYCTKQGWYPIRVNPTSRDDPETLQALAQIRRVRRQKRARLAHKATAEEISKKLASAAREARQAAWRRRQKRPSARRAVLDPP